MTNKTRPPGPKRFGPRKIKVLVVDDSAVVRQTLTRILESDPEIEVMGTAHNPYAAVAKMRNAAPDVIILDIQMPRMDGLTFLQKVMQQHPIPVIICSTLAASGADASLRALEYGAVELIQKPSVGTKRFLDESTIRVCDAVKTAAQVRVKRRSPAVLKATPKLTADAVLPKPSTRAVMPATERIVAVGASTGGTHALKVLLQGVSDNGPGIVIVQHMPAGFTAAFADQLNGQCNVEVKEASNGDSVPRGCALVAPGNRHMLLKRAGARYYVEVRDGPLVSRHRPSVDVLFRSAARYAGSNAVGVIMTGMGDDGAKGMAEMRRAGAYTVAQDEASCVVFGMPNEAIKLDAVDQVVELPLIGKHVAQVCDSAPRRVRG